MILPALASLGAIAGIAAVGWLAEERTAARPRVKRRVDVILRDLESATLGVGEILRRVIRQSPMFGLVGPASSAPMKFGLPGPRIDAGQGQLYTALVNDMASVLVLATQAAVEVTSAIEDGDLEPPEAFFDRLGAAQDRLNTLLSARAPAKAAVEGALAISDTLAGSCAN